MKSAIFLGNINSPLAINRFLILIDELPQYEFLFFDKSTGIPFTKKEVHTFSDKRLNSVVKENFIKKIFFKFYALIKFAGLIRNFDVELVHVHGASTLLLVFPLYFYKVKVLTTCQGSDIGFGYRFPYSIFTKLLLNRSDVITVKSNQMANQVREIVNKRITLLNWGVSSEFFNRSAKSTQETANQIRIVSMRSARSLYNIPIIFESIKNLKIIYGEKVHFTVYFTV